MSYILDAIKKSDKQRELGSTPDVHTIHETPLAEPPRRPGWLYGLAAILLLNAGVLGWWLWSGTATKTPVTQNPEKPAVAQTLPETQRVPPQQRPPFKSKQLPQPTQVALSPKPSVTNPPVVQADAPLSAPVPVPPPSPAEIAVAAPDNRATASSNVATPPPTQPSINTVPPATPVSPQRSTATPQMAQPETKPANQPAVVQAEATKPPIISPPPSVSTDKDKTVVVSRNENIASVGVEPSAPKASSVAVVPVQTPDTPPDNQEDIIAEDETVQTADEDLDTEMAATKEILSPIASSAAPKNKAKKRDRGNEDPELAKIPLLNQLPQEIQQTIPELHISFHSYSIKPATRLVSISGKILREGEAFNENVKLETITTQGVVMSINERRFRLQVNPSSRF